MSHADRPATDPTAASAAPEGASMLQTTAHAPTPDEAPTLLPGPNASHAVQPDSVVGAYRLVRLLGEGGMGQVWEAEQSAPIRRTVALKLIKWGMDTGEFLARFASERQALALMNHPHIARVFDAGATETGRPYLVMEYAPGEALTDYCDRKRLTVGERLVLFQQVCDGVQHAHQKGIIHRDLKPSNVLVTEVDGKPVPKIIDFGLAKATDQRQTQRTVYTRMGQVVGTLEYMSPEQVTWDEPDIDTRTDVYSLGVILYELLTGVLPLESRELRGGSWAELERAIREKEPPKPSSRARTSETALELARKRRSEPKGLSRQLHPDLDWIAMKALEKDRARRYGSAAELAADVGRHLRNEPVTAGRPSRAYRARKFVRRHRVGVAAAAAVLVVLVAGIIGTTVGLAKAQTAEASAKQEAATTEQVSGFLVGLFEVSDPSEARGNTVTAREILDKGAEELNRETELDPLIRARMLVTIGKVYTNLGLSQRAVPLLEGALALQEQRLGRDDPTLGPTLQALANAYFDTGGFGENIDKVWKSLERCVAIYRKSDPPDDRRLAEALALLGQSKFQGAFFEESERYLREAMTIQTRILPRDDPDWGWTLYGLALLHRDALEPDAAVVLGRRLVALAEKKFGPEHLTVADVYQRLAELLANQGRLEEADAYSDRAVAMEARLLGPEAIEGGEAWFKEALGKFDEAERLLIAQLRWVERKYGPQETGDQRFQLGDLYLRQGDSERARRELEQALALASTPGQATGIRSLLARASLLAGNLDAAREHTRLAMEGLDRMEGWKPGIMVTRGQVVWRLGEAYVQEGLLQEAEPVLNRGAEFNEEYGGELPWSSTQKRYLWASYHALMGNPDEALRILREALAENHDQALRLFDVVHPAPSDPDAQDLATDPNLVSLRGLPEFEAIVAEVRERRKGRPQFEEATAYALLGETDQALASLREAVDRGFSDAARLAAERDFDTLRGLAEFEAMVGEIERRAAERAAASPLAPPVKEHTPGS